MTRQDTLARHDTVTGPSQAMDLRSPVCTDAVWRLPVTVCRITQFLCEQTAGALLERAIASAGDTLKPSMIRDREVVPDFRRSRSRHDFAATELMAAIDEVLEAVEHTLGVSCQHTEPSYSLNAHNDGDFYRPHQDTSAEFAPGVCSHSCTTCIAHPGLSMGASCVCSTRLCHCTPRQPGDGRNAPGGTGSLSTTASCSSSPLPGMRYGRSAARASTTRTAVSPSTAGCAAPTPRTAGMTRARETHRLRVRLAGMRPVSRTRSRRGHVSSRDCRPWCAWDGPAMAPR